MKPFVSAVAAVALLVSIGAADETPPATPTPVTGTPVVVGTTAAPVEAIAVAAAPQRRGLFSRLRNRNSSTTTMTPTTTLPVTGTTVATPGTVVTPGTVITPAPTTTPVPMPRPMPGTKTPNAMTMPAAPNGIVLAGGTTDVMMTSGTVTPASYTTPTTQRRGLFGRLRNR